MVLLRGVIGSFLVQLGLVHAALWLWPAPTVTLSAPGWWLLRGIGVHDVRGCLVLVTVAVVLLLAAGGVGLIFDLPWWRVPAGAGSLVALFLVGLFIPSWWLAPVGLIDGMLIGTLVWAYLRRRAWHAARRHARGAHSSRDKGLGTAPHSSGGAGSIGGNPDTGPASG